MLLNNSFNILPWYDSVEKQSSKKWYAFGQSWPLLCPQGAILPFQFISSSAFEITSNIFAVNKNTGDSTDLGVAPTITAGTQAGASYYVVKNSTARVPVLPIGTYYLRFNTSLGYLYSEEIAIIDDVNTCLKIEYWNEDTLYFTSGEINFADDFKFEFYIRSTIGKPEYEFEEELTKRLGYKFIESQTSNKLYKFAFAAPEYICDAMRLIRLCDYIKITTAFDSYNALSFAYEPKWQDQGDLASVEVEFDTDCIIQKLESFNRRIKESFYNALLADIDEPVLFSSDTVAQYYTEFTTTSFINGKLIRQLEAASARELKTDLANIVIPVDNQADSQGVAKKVFLQDILGLTDAVSKLFKGHYDEAGNLTWIEALSNIGVNGSITMNIDNGTIPLPSIFDSLPIDGITLVRDENGVLMLNPDINFGGGGVSDFWDLNNIPKWITSSKPVYQYSEIQGAPDLSIYAKSSDVDTRINNLINGAPAAYDTLKEIADVLQGNVNSIGDIISTLGGKANKATTLAGYSISDAKISRGSITLGEETITPLTSHQTIYALTLQAGTFSAGTYTPNSATKTINIPTTTAHISESDNLYFTNERAVNALSSTLANYVTLGGSQTITGAKNFTGGLRVNGGSLVYNATEGYWKLEGNLLVTGGVSMYNSGDSDIPSGGGSGSIDYPLSWSGFSSGSFDGSAAKTIYIPSKLSELTNDSGYALSSALSGYLSTSGGTVTGRLNVDGTFALNSCFLLSATNGNWKVTDKDWQHEYVLLHSSNYSDYALPKSGGTLSNSGFGGALTINRAQYNNDSIIRFTNDSDGELGYIGMQGSHAGIKPLYVDKNGNRYFIYHTGNFNPSDYLPLSGGTIKAVEEPLTIHRDMVGSASYIIYKNRDEELGRLGFFGGLNTNPYEPFFADKNGTSRIIIHSGNIGSQSVSYASSAGDAQILSTTKASGITNDVTFKRGFLPEANYNDGNWGSPTGTYNSGEYAMAMRFADGKYYHELWFNLNESEPYWKQVVNGVSKGWRKFAFTDSNVASATNADKVDGYHASNIFTYEGVTYVNGESSLWDSLGTKVYADALPDGLTGVYKYGQTISFGVGLAKFEMYVSHAATNPDYDHTTGGIYVRSGWDTDRKPWRRLAFMDGNVASATKLQTARTIWGQSFDGTSSIIGDIWEVGDINTHSSYTDIYIKLNTDSRSWWTGIGINSGDDKYIIYDATAKSHRLAIDASGNVGIGETNPAYKLDVNGAICANGHIVFNATSDAKIGQEYATTDTTLYNYIKFNGGANGIQYYSGLWTSGDHAAHQFYTHGSSNPRMVVANNGRVGIGTTTPSYKLDIHGEVADSVPLLRTNVTNSVPWSYAISMMAPNLSVGHKVLISFGTSHSFGNAGVMYYNNAGDNNDYNYIGFGIYGTNDILNITKIGNVGIGTNIPSAKLHVSGNILTSGAITMNSMRSMKDIVDERGLSLSELIRIKPTRFRWKDGRDDRIHVGGIADDVMKVLPEVVFKGNDGVLSMDYASAAFVMTASLIKPMTEHERRIANLERENTLLKEEIRNLKRA